MHVIFNAIDDDGFAVGLVDEIADDAEEFRSPFFVDHCASVLDCKDSLQIDLVVGVGHDVWFSERYGICVEPTALNILLFLDNGLKPVV
jgi:hypothetical protein